MAKKNKPEFWVCARDSCLGDKVIVPVNTWKQGQKIEEVLLGKSEMKYVSINVSKPPKPKRGDRHTYKTYSDVSKWTATNTKLAQKRLKKRKGSNRRMMGW